MKQSIIIVFSLVLICLHLAIADVESVSQNMQATSHSEGVNRVASIHQRIIAVPSSRQGTSKASEYNSVPTIDRTIETLRRFRRVRKSVTGYPKHHRLQPLELPLDEVHPKEGLNSTTAPYTDNHHSWKSIPSILQ